eukprot:CAMPEP_0119500342 /NCGR_PEP_ID=MMETSP1344-20130328/22519_1 /TAXON_ID=236787 /ORGANISM="Florenciella parvula, Strain CCMP2471" /LENGTH=79 /DNA_ID=CAMNT_0007536419 /DNA_START=50 /DNA_END=286 /DNA_ORIENTATION=+
MSRAHSWRGRSVTEDDGNGDGDTGTESEGMSRGFSLLNLTRGMTLRNLFATRNGSDDRTRLDDLSLGNIREEFDDSYSG